MGKEEFLRRLEDSLQGEVPLNVIRDNLNYYDDYIEGEIKKGLSAKEVTASIGDPRLIARTIIDSTPGAGGPSYSESSAEDSQGRDDGSYGRRTSESGTFHYYDLSRWNKWYWKLLAVVSVVLFLWLVLAVVGGIFTLLLPLLPFLLIGYVILAIFRGSRR